MFTINISISSVALLTQCGIGVLTIMKAMKLKRNLNKCLLTGCFLFSFCSCCVSTVSWMINCSLWYISGSEQGIPLPTLSLYFLSSGVFILSILGTFILRLHMTFKHRLYRMALPLKMVFILLLSASLLGFVVLSTSCFILPWDHWLHLLYPILFPSICLYLIGIVLALYFFVSRLTKLAKAQEITLRDSKITLSDIKLDKQQQELSDLAAKYTMLFSITLLSTVLMQILGLIVNLHSGLRWALIAVDFTVNLHCIYLQFSWAKGDYGRWCGCCDHKFRGIITRRTQKRIYKHSIELLKTKVGSESWSNSASHAEP